jgi:hypothetical protein
LRAFGELPDTDYCATAPVDCFLKVSVPLPFAAFGAENQIDKRVGLMIRGPQRKKCPIYALGCNFLICDIDLNGGLFV